MTSLEFRTKEPGKVESNPVSIYTLSSEIEALALEIAKGPITAETLVPLLDAIMLEENRKELEWMESQERDTPDYFAHLSAQDQEERKIWKEKLRSAKITPDDREGSYEILLKSGGFDKIFLPVLKKRYPRQVGEQMDQLSKALHMAANKETERK